MEIRTGASALLAAIKQLGGVKSRVTVVRPPMGLETGPRTLDLFVSSWDNQAQRDRGLRTLEDVLGDRDVTWTYLGTSEELDYGRTILSYVVWL